MVLITSCNYLIYLLVCLRPKDFKCLILHWIPVAWDKCRALDGGSVHICGWIDESTFVWLVPSVPIERFALKAT